MSTTDQLLPCPFCGGEARMHPNNWLSCTLCNIFTDIHDTQSKALAHWNSRASPPAAVPEPWGWLCNGKGNGWEERDKVVRDPGLIARYRERPDLWRIEPLYLGSPHAVPEGWVMVPVDPDKSMLRAALLELLTEEEAKACYRAMISAAPAAPEDRAIYANLLAVITDIRHKTAVGGKPMLSELADAIAEKIKAASPPTAVPDDWITRLKDAIEGECHGLAITDEQARSILSYVISAAPAAPNGWRSVRDDPPPKDGRWILATNIGWHGDCEVLGWHFGAWRRSPSTDSDDFTITHWQPLPAAPAEASDE